MDKSLSAWHEEGVKNLGLAAQSKAEAIVERELNDYFVSVWDTKTGESNQYKSGVAEVYAKRREIEYRSRKSFLVPDFPWKHKEGES